MSFAFLDDTSFPSFLGIGGVESCFLQIDSVILQKKDLSFLR